MQTAENLGAKLAVHAVGNGAVNSLLSAHQGSNLLNQVPIRIEHAMTLSPLDIDSIAKSYLPTVSQPGFLKYFGHQLNAVELPRPLALMPFKSMLSAGIKLAFSSDYRLLISIHGFQFRLRF
jgi:predicted amidohydrolase YtcJ